MMPLNKPTFDSFVQFSNILTQESRQKLAEYLYEKLLGKDVSQYVFSEQEKSYQTLLDKVINNSTLKELSAQHSEIAHQNTLDILQWLKREHFKSQITDKFTLLQKEKDKAKSLAEVEISKFVKSFEPEKKRLEKSYPELDVSFYAEQIEDTTLNKKNKKKNELISLEAIQAAFSKRWEKLLLEQQIQYELAEIDKVRAAFCKALYEKAEQFKQLKALLSPFTEDLGRLWDMSGGLWRNINFNVLQKYADMLQKDASLKELATLLGKMRTAEHEYEEEIVSTTTWKQAYKVEHASKSELVGVHESNDLNTLLPSEMALLSTKETESIFFKKFAESKLLTFRYQGKSSYEIPETEEEKRQKAKEKDKGPFIICVDTSGSMHGTPEYVAKVLSFALVKIALQEKRKCYLISFSTQIETIELTDLSKSLEKIVAFLSMSFHGGTDATPALTESLKMLKTEDYQKADVIMVSDFVMGNLGTAISSEMNIAKEKGTKFHSLTISTSGNSNVINTFDNNWLYNPNDSRSIKRLIENVRGLSNPS